MRVLLKTVEGFLVKNQMLHYGNAEKERKLQAAGKLEQEAYKTPLQILGKSDIRVGKR